MIVGQIIVFDLDKQHAQKISNAHSNHIDFYLS
jgi:hypothetical protein